MIATHTMGCTPSNTEKVRLPQPGTVGEKDQEQVEQRGSVLMARPLLYLLTSSAAFGSSTLIPLPNSVHRSKKRSRGCASDMTSSRNDEPYAFHLIYDRSHDLFALNLRI